MSRDELAAKAFRVQAAICRHLEAPFYGELLGRCAEDLEPDSPIARVVSDWSGDLVHDFVALRMIGGVHELVLSGSLPQLARHYPTTGGAPRWPEAWQLFRSAVAEHRETLRAFLSTTPQTNEIGRAAALAAGFHQIVRQFGRPLRLRELGASAGLNLFWDRYAYEFGKTHWGKGDGRPCLRPQWSGPAPPLASEVVIESRAGCDLQPIDVRDPGARARLEAYVWADHPERLQRLRAALALAVEDPPRLVQSAAGTWLTAELEARPSGAATVVYHSSFWAFLSEAERSTIAQGLERCGEQAGRDSPLAWLRLEDADDRVELWLRSWPDGGDRMLAESNAHGRWIRWVDEGREEQTS